ncbi:BatD family protein [Hymenobacter sp. BT559]|uniref:BatD family protein n=1 Tax=Hymenobacter sp. BT559 TaxID=2795729 RepID=UPI0018ED098C|nr:BatD family protein [Hymenobacter sp. BT559]MBJ6143329.1 BatD family protein [Hymenobacter sp. BT559]
MTKCAFFGPQGLGWLLCLLLLCSSGVPARAQQPAPATEVELVPGPAVIPLTATYSLGVRVRGAAITSHSEFPELEGFRKAGLTKTTATRLVAGRGSVAELTLTQRYAPYSEGTYQIPAFDLTVNGQVLHSPGGRVRVAAAPATAPLTDATVGAGQGVGSLDQLLGKPKPKYFYEPPDHASLALEASQNKVFVGEGVRVALYLYLQPADQAVLNFYNFTEQLPELVRQLRQPTAWEVPAAETAIVPDTVRRGGAVYLRFRLAETTYYPLTAQELRFPPLALVMTKFKLLKKPQPGEEEKLAFYKTYTAPAVRVAVRPLPARPGAPAGSVPVGHYTLHEGVSGVRFRTGEAFVYTFGVEGAGNTSALVLPTPRSTDRLEVYGPDIKEEKLPDGTPRKSFRYRLVPHQPGVLALDSLFRLVFFDPTTSRYDTLCPELRPEVRGVARPIAAANPAEDPFYGPALGRADSQLQPLDVYQDVRRYAGWLLGALLVVAAVGWWRSS